MNNILIIFKKELRSYFNSPIAYIFVIVFLVVSNWLFFSRFFLSGQVSMRSFSVTLPWIFLIILPALSMRLWAEEKRQGSIELLLTLPIKDIHAVMGKFLAAFIFMLFTIALTLPTAFTVASLGNLDRGTVASSYMGTLLLAGSFLAFGAFLSSLTRNQIVAFLLTLVFSFILVIIGQDYVLAPTSGFVAGVLNFISLSTHYHVMIRGLQDIGDIVDCIGCIFLFLFLNVKVLQSRYYKG